MSNREKERVKEEKVQPEKERGSRLLGRATGDSSGESSGSCTSGSGYEGLSLLGMLLVPVALKSRKKIGL